MEFYMNSILPIHFGFSSNDADTLPLAIDRLGGPVTV
jgi:hypothetical protein